MKSLLDALLRATIHNCYEGGLLVRKPLPDYVIEIPNNPDHGHFATNLPMALASGQRRSPREIASIILDQIRDDSDLLERAEIAGPGFINFRIRSSEWYRVLSDIVRFKHDYGRSETGNDQKVLVEFVSANPTGPLHLGHGRGAALGDTLCRILSFRGYDVVREFYINDAGRQIRVLGESIFSRFKQIDDAGYPFPEDAYHGDYIHDLAKMISEKTDLSNMSDNEAIEVCAQEGKKIMLDEIKQDLVRFGVDFDIWYSERDIIGSGALDDILSLLDGEGQLFKDEGAVWIKTTDFGDDKDRVLRKKDGQFTYFASDISYHLEKRKRGFDKAINLWGADHHGYIPRIKAALACRGLPEDWLSVMLIQLVRLWKGGQEIKMSKRTGNFVTLQELVDEVGVDAARFVFLTKSHDSALDFDVDLVRKRDSDNPVYYVQYAHARICSVFRKAGSEGIFLPAKSDGLLGRLVLDEEMALIRTMAGFPSLLEDISKGLEPHRLTYYLTDLAASFHRYFNLGTKTPEHRMVTDDRALSGARLFLAEAVKIVIANGLRLLGVSAPEKM
ncbi:MAG: arginine--tRNA ligase [Thermodesulfobacteriota bacterium]|nr:arginine--tRNA ligase [Thermodesulfobacteriota bacterium]